MTSESPKKCSDLNLEKLNDKQIKRHSSTQTTPPPPPSTPPPIFNASHFHGSLNLKTNDSPTKLQNYINGNEKLFKKKPENPNNSQSLNVLKIKSSNLNEPQKFLNSNKTNR